MAVLEGKLSNGFDFSVDDRVAEDWRFVEAITDSESKDASVQLRGVRNLVDLVFGADEGARLKDYIAKANDGFVPTTEIQKCVTEVLQSINESKN